MYSAESVLDHYFVGSVAALGVRWLRKVSMLRRVVLLAVAMTVGALVLSPSHAAAHTAFESSTPSDGSTADAIVSDVVLRFSDVAEPAGPGFVVLGPDGFERVPDLITSDPAGQIWTLSFDPPLASGAVGVRWTVRAPDAHPIEGAFSFTIAGPDPDPPNKKPDELGDDLTGSSDESATSASEPRGTGGGDGTDQAEVDGIDPETDDGLEAASEDLDRFLTRSGDSAPDATALGAVGRLLRLFGTILAVGGLAFAAVVLQGQRADSRSVLNAVRYCGALVVLGAALELAAEVVQSNADWTSLTSAAAIGSGLASDVGRVAGLRIAAGIVVLVALTERGAGDEAHPEGSTIAGATSGAEPPAGPVLAGLGNARLPTPGLVIAVVVLLGSFTLDGHTVTEGNRWVTGAVDVVHVLAGSVWAGGVVALAGIYWLRHRRREPLQALELAVRFSVLAAAAVSVAGIAGSALTVIILDEISELWSTSWGLLLLAKAVAVTAAGSFGAYNHFVLIPGLQASPANDGSWSKLRTTVTVEASVLLLVITVTAFLISAAS